MRAYRVSFIARVVIGKLAYLSWLRAPEDIWGDIRALEVVVVEGLLGAVGGGV